MTAHQYHHIVITCGISLFNGFNVFRKWTDEQGVFVFERSNPLAPENIAEKDVIKAWEKAVLKTDLRKIADGHPKNISAEYSLLYSLQSAGRLGKEPEVVLIHTDTIGGKAATVLLERLLPKDFRVRVRLREVADIDTGNRNILRRSLGGFMETVAASLENSDPAYTCFAPVGGYKVMTSLGYLAGAYMGFPTAYLHEDNQALHEIPGVPIRIDTSELRKLAPLMLKLRRSVWEWDKLTEDEKTQIRQNAYLFERADTLVGCNAFAEFLMKRPENREIFRKKTLIHPELKTLLADGVTSRFISQQIEELHKKLESPIAYRGELHHETTFDNLKQTQYALYKGASQGRHIFRAAYAYDEDSGTLTIKQIWTDHDAYERDANDGSVMYTASDPKVWTEV